MSDKVLGWHWLLDNGCLRHPPYTKVKINQTLTAKGPLEVYENGMHASRRALDALGYAPGAIVCRVELSGEVVEDGDQLCARHRKVLAMDDATAVLHEFVGWCAKRALLCERKAGREPDRRSWDAIEVKRKWMNGEATDEELEMARIAAWDAAWSVSWTPTLNASDAAYWSAASDRIWYAAKVAATAAAWVASDAVFWNAAKEAVWNEQNTKLEEMLNDLLKGDGVFDS